MITTTAIRAASAATSNTPRRRYNLAALVRGTLLTLGAAAIHFAVVPQHLDEYLPFGLFFLLCGAAQVALALAVVARPRPQLFAAGALATLGVLILWAISWTIGLPLGPTPGRPDDMGMADVITGILEALAILQLGLLLRRPRLPGQPAGKVWRVVRTGLRGLGLLITLLLVGAVTAVGVLAGLHPMAGTVNMSAPVPGQPSVALTTLTEPPGAQPVKRFTLTTEIAQINGQAVWTYNGTVPGPALRVTQGDRVRVTLINHLPAATTIHWHGLVLPNAEDGVASITQDAVPPGASYTYEFVVRDAGTYWYHSHQDGIDQVTRGLYGALVVKPAQGPAPDHDYAVALGSLGGQVAANGRTGELHLAAQPGESVRLRLINAAPGDLTGVPEALTLVGAPYRVVALDGHDLNQPAMLGPAVLAVGAGQRYDLVFQMPATGQVWLLDTASDTLPGAGPDIPAHKSLLQMLEGLEPGGVPTHSESITLGTGPAPPVPSFARLPPFDLTTYGTPAPDPLLARTTFDVDKQLVISDDHGFRDGMFQFIFMFNGAASPDAAPILVRPGQVVRLRFVNNTDFYHPMHLHGHIFTVLSKNGQPLTGSPVHQDTVLVGPHETWEVAFVADNPGLWMLHCHVMIHASFGLSMMVDYAGITTPYNMGPESGNRPE